MSKSPSLRCTSSLTATNLSFLLMLKSPSLRCTFKPCSIRHPISQFKPIAQFQPNANPPSVPAFHSSLCLFLSLFSSPSPFGCWLFFRFQCRYPVRSVKTSVGSPARTVVLPQYRAFPRKREEYTCSLSSLARSTY